MKKVLILGGTGLLGTNLSQHLKSKYRIITQGFSKKADLTCDLTKLEQVVDLLNHVKPDSIINTVAETSVERCEEEPVQAFNLNVLPVINILKSLKKLNLDPHIIHISTDHLYNNHFSSENKLVFLNNYALTKYWAEQELKNTNTTILRTNFFGGDTDFRLSFSGWALKNLKASSNFMGFDDVFFSPLHIESFIEAILPVLEKKTNGIFNLGTQTELSKYSFIQELAKNAGLDGTHCKPTKYLESKIKTPRPQKMSMNVCKFETAFQHKLPSLIEDIKRVNP